MSERGAADSAARRQAVDPTRSFIVQAPAGSGKTSLLTQRFLALLARAGRPEEILAITFTRKAAAEMRHRVVQALTLSGRPLPPDASEHERETRELAAAALAHGERLGWDIERHPSRLHIQTIDGLNHWLARRLPLSARLGIGPEILDDARPAYAQAARRLLARMEEQDAPEAASIARLVELLDHDAGRLQDLVATMLGRRELWLPKVLELNDSADPRSDMEGFLAAAVEAELVRIRGLLAGPLMAEAVSLLRQAAAAVGPGGPLDALARGEDLPEASTASRSAWDCLARALLTKDGKARKSVNRNVGFPPELRKLKERMTGLLARLAGEESTVEALRRVAWLPPQRYTDEQWERVAALCRALVPAAAELQTEFAERGQLDHAAVAAAAREALGGPEAPTELSQALEYRIRHILVDEYQDTSPVQEALLERLVAGWQPQDGHTLFCVGDPMQSIYGFREADVTLFLQAQSRGLGGAPLEPLVLQRNFRSCEAVVDWVNAAFARLLPSQEDYERGAVCHAPSVATRANEPGAGVHVHALIGPDESREAALVAELIERALSETGEGRAVAEKVEDEVPGVAVLVRSRSVLPPLLEELRRRGIGYRGVELEGLAERAAVRDLLALARALVHRGDRTAWLAVLRAPWCGLSLADLHALAAGDREATIGSLLADQAALEAVSDDARRRLSRILPALEQGCADVGRRALGTVLRSVWLAIGGPASADDASDLANAEACFAALDALAKETRGLPTGAEIEAAVRGLMASPVGEPAARVQLMTIHRSKGLEFDTVILPGLDRQAPSGERQLLYWSAVALESGERGIVLASRGEAGDDRQRDALEEWMKSLEREREDFELGRVAYVAATRARRSLHLVGSVSVAWDEDEVPKLVEPNRRTLLRFFWPLLAHQYLARFEEERARGNLERRSASPRPRRSAPPLVALPVDFSLAAGPPPPLAPAARAREPEPEPVRPQFDWAGEEAIAVGTVVHAELERLAAAGTAPAAMPRRPDAWRAHLYRLGLPASRIGRALARVEEALLRVRRSELAARLLDPASREAASELALTAVLDGELVNVKIDRTFVDEEGRRWIVDWKTSAHEGGGRAEFLARELERYGPQLERYARVMSAFDSRPQRIGLYFPLLDAWQDYLPGSGRTVRARGDAGA